MILDLIDFYVKRAKIKNNRGADFTSAEIIPYEHDEVILGMEAQKHF